MMPRTVTIELKLLIALCASVARPASLDWTKAQSNYCSATETNGNPPKPFVTHQASSNRVAAAIGDGSPHTT